MKNILKKWIPLLSVVPFIVGSAGYIIAGEGVTDSLYASFALYFVNPVSDGRNILIEFARWSAALVTTTVILFAVRTVWKNIGYWFRCLFKESVAVYSDSDIEIAFDKKVKVIYPGRECKHLAKSHIIMFKSDTDSLKFYEENKKLLEGRAVYIGLKEIEYGFMKDNPNVIFFDINGSLARKLWKSIGIWRRGKRTHKITIYGSSVLAGNVLSYGLLLNLYSDTQCISYHLVSDDRTYAVKHKEMETGNKDELHYYATDDDAVWDVIRTSDIVILAEEPSAELLQAVSVLCQEGEVYYYSPKSGDVGDYLDRKNIRSFGRERDIFSDENIRQEKLLEKAKQLNLRYAEAYGGEKDWNKLNGFLKWSNISSADFNEILGELIDANADLEMLSELEHIRWCRFHYLNYWKYGVPENGKSKDPKRRIHTCLVSYSKLGEDEKEKDREVVASARQGEAFISTSSIKS